MSLSAILDAVIKLYDRIVDGVKWLGVIIFTRKYTQAQTENKQLEVSNAVKDQQLHEAAQPHDDFDSILDSMRRDEF